MSSGPADFDAAASWTIGYHAYDPADEGRREAMLALGNGMLFVRAAAVDAGQDEVHYPGTYRAGCYDRIADIIDGEMDATDTLVNLPNWLPVQFRIGAGPWLNLDSAELTDYFHGVDLQTGTMRRDYKLTDAAGRSTRLREHRVVSMAEPHLCSLRLELTPLNWSGALELRSVLDGDVVNANVSRYADYTRRHLAPSGCEAISDRSVMLSVRTLRTGVGVSLALRTSVEADDFSYQPVLLQESRIEQSMQVVAVAGTTVAVEKVLALCTTQDPGVEDPPLSAARLLEQAGDYARLHAAHAHCWKQLWSRAALEVAHGEVDRALRFHVFHLLQTVSPRSAELDVGIPARGWHGEVYRGHIFWDEIFIFPFLNLRFPKLSRAVLLYRYRRLDAAREQARRAGFRGAMYPWRSASDGHEVTPRHQKNMLTGAWMPDHTNLQHHIGSAIAFNVWHYYLATGDREFLCDHGAEMILEIARFWGSIAQPSEKGDRFEIRGVIGPDEYHNAYPDSDRPGLDNNAYTNLMAVWTLCCAAQVLEKLPPERREELRRRLGLGEDELASWDRISRRMFVPFQGDGIISQYQGFEKLREFQPEQLPGELRDQRVDWALDAIGESADRYQITKQADVLTLFYLLSEDVVIELLDRLGYSFDRDALCRTARYYLARTTHRSSLSRIIYSGALAQVDPALSWSLYEEALGTDLQALKGESTAEGVHLGAMGGTLDTLQRRYLGLSADADGLHVTPALPAQLGSVRMGFLFCANALEIEVKDCVMHLRSAPDNATEVPVWHQGDRSLLQPGGELRIDCSATAQAGAES